MDDDSQLIVSTFNDGHQQRQVPSIFDLSAASAADSKATSPEDLLHSWNSVHSAIRSLDSKLAKRLLREWQELKIEDVNLGGLSLDILKRMKPSELDKLMQGMTIAHIGPARGKDWAELPSWAAFRFFVPAWTSQKPPIFGNRIFAGLLYNMQASNYYYYYYYYYYCLIAPPLYLTYLSYLELKVYLKREIERKQRGVFLVKRRHLVKRSISSRERAGGCRPPHPPLVKKGKVRLTPKT